VPLPHGTDGDAPPARKRAAKKTAAKKTAVKKTAAKKTVAKKTVAKKAAKTSAPESTPVISIPVIIETPPAPKKKTVRAKKSTEAPAVAETSAPPPVLPPASDDTRRYGRVPGGGPTTPRESPAPEAPQSQQATRVDETQGSEPRQPQHPQQRSFQNRNDPQQGQPQNPNNPNGQSRESRSKRRREKRKRRGEQRQQGQQGEQRQQGQQPHQSRHANQNAQNPPRHEPNHEPRPIQLNGPKIETDGMLELAPKGFGFLRVPQKGFEQARDDVFVTPETIRKFNLRLGQWIHGVYQEGPRGPQLVEITTINGMAPEAAAKLPHFEELKAINPTRRISFETTPERFTTRVVDIMAPVGRGQRGLIVSPPRSGKTTLLLHMAEAIREKYDEAIHLMVLLVDERPEEVTEFRRALPGAEIYASSNDEQPRNHCRIAELAIERAKRLVEAGQDVFLLMDSITRLARAYNNTMNNRGRGTGSGGITIGALEVPRRLFAAARNTRGGGSLTIMATALIQTNSRADEAIFMEFKGTGNMELVLDRKIAENYIYPAVDIFKSGTRREELLIPDHMLHKIHLIRRGLSGHRPVEAMERLLFFLKKFPNNPQMLLEIKG